MYNEERKAIKNYIEEKNTDYAIMIRGQWGVGKTFFVKNNLMTDKKNKYLYKSVSGISNIEEFIKKINIELFLLTNNDKKIKKMILNTKVGYIADIIDLLPYINKSKNILKNFFEKIQNNLLNKNNNFENTILVIDDLERLSDTIYIKDLLYRIYTQFITKGLKVIFVSNEEAIIDDMNNEKVNDYNIIKEKIIRYTIDISSNFTTVINNILLEKQYKFINDKEHINELISLCTNSKHPNIRTFLQYLELSKKLNDIISNELVEKHMYILLEFVLIEINSGKKDKLKNYIEKYKLETFNLNIENMEDDKDYKYFKNYINNIFYTLMYTDITNITDIINDIINYIISFYLKECNIKNLDSYYTETTIENSKFNKSNILLNKLEKEQLYNNQEIKECLEKIYEIINDYKINGNNSSVCNDNIIKNIKITYNNYIDKYDDNLYKDEKEKIKSLLDKLTELEKYDFSNLESDEIIRQYNMYLNIKKNNIYSTYNNKFEEELKNAYINAKNKILDEILEELKNKNFSLFFSIRYDTYYKNIETIEIINDKFLNKLEINPFNLYFISLILENIKLKNIKLEQSKYDLINDFISEIKIENYDYNTKKMIDYLKGLLDNKDNKDNK